MSTSSTPTDLTDLYMKELASISREFPGFQITAKSGSRLCKVLNAVLWVLTLGQTTFMTQFVTVLGKTVYTPPSWEHMTWGDRWIILRHEGLHLRQADRMFFGWSFWVGWVIWSFCYLFVLPFGITLRARWEREAYTESIRCSQRLGRPVSRAKLFRTFTGPQYVWMDLRESRVSEWLDRLGVN